MREAVAQGLDRVSLLPVGGGFASLSAGVAGVGRGVSGFGQTEVGYRPAAGVDLYGYGKVSVPLTLVPSYEAGVGLRARW